MDVKRNFEERWQKLTTSRETIMTDLYLTRYENELRYNRFDKRPISVNINKFYSYYNLHYRTCDEFDEGTNATSHYNWTIQVLRSISSASCHFSNVDRRRFLNISKSGQLVDDTVYRSLIWQIRNAKR